MSESHPEMPNYPETVQDTVGVIRVDHFELARKGLDISFKAGRVSKEVRDRLLSTWSQLGNETSGPELAGVNGTAESTQQ